MRYVCVEEGVQAGRQTAQQYYLNNWCPRQGTRRKVVSSNLDESGLHFCERLIVHNVERGRPAASKTRFSFADEG